MHRRKRDQTDQQSRDLQLPRAAQPNLIVRIGNALGLFRMCSNHNKAHRRGGFGFWAGLSAHRVGMTSHQKCHGVVPKLILNFIVLAFADSAGDSAVSHPLCTLVTALKSIRFVLQIRLLLRQHVRLGEIKPVYFSPVLLSYKPLCSDSHHQRHRSPIEVELKCSGMLCCM
jgi:hypothetical protein